jgi:hypothetical protein
MATIAILVWPLVTAMLFAMSKDRNRAVLVALLGGHLFLPSSFSIALPGLPDIDREAVTILSIAAMLLVTKGGFGKFLPTRLLPVILIVTSLVAPVLTVLTNNDPISVPGRILPGLSIYDSLTPVFTSGLALLIFMTGFNHFRNESEHRKILWLIVIAGFVYSAVVLFEARVSPQLHFWVYRFYPQDFIQAVRGDGFRPHGFLRGGLHLSFFMFLVLMAAIALWRDGRAQTATMSRRRMPGVLIPYFAFILFVCKSLGAILFGITMAPVAALLRARFHVRIAFALALFAVLYPQLRGLHLVPTQQIVDLAAVISPARAASLQFRFDNEDQLLAHASDRLLFGWGSFSRNRVFNEDGRDISITDGLWIIRIGSFGWVGFIAFFGLMAYPILQLWRQARRLQPGFVTSVLALMLAVNMIELLPNSTTLPLIWLVAGALTGYVTEGSRLASRARQRLTVPPRLLENSAKPQAVHAKALQ